MSERIEGTYHLDGLVEGPLPDNAEVEQQMRDWIELTCSLNLHFSLEIEGHRFSLLALDDVATNDTHRNVRDEIAQALEQLLKLFPRRMQTRITSTLRSIEYTKGFEVQTVYAIRPDGQVDTKQRRIQVETTPPPQPPSTRERLRLGLLGLGVALLILLVSSVFVDYRALLDQTLSAVMPMDPAELQVKTGPFESLLEVADKKLKARVLVLQLKRTKDYPCTPDALCEAWSAAAGDLERRLTLEALAKGYLRCEAFDDKGAFLQCTVHRISELAGEKKSAEIRVPLPRRKRIKKVVLRY